MVAISLLFTRSMVLLTCLWITYAWIGKAYAEDMAVTPKGVRVPKEIMEPAPELGVTFATGIWELLNPGSQYQMPKDAAHHLGKDGVKIVQQYRTRIRDYQYGVGLLEGTGNVAIGAGSAMGAAAVVATGVGSVPLAIGVAAATVGNRAAAEAIHENTKTRTAKLFVDGLNGMNQADQKIFSSKLGAKDYKGAADFFEQRTHKVSAIEAEVKKIHEKYGDSQEVLDTTREMVNEVLIGATAESLRAAADNYNLIGNVKDDLSAHIVFTQRVTSQTDKRLKSLKGEMTQLQGDIKQLGAGLSDVAKETKATSYQVGLIQEMLFDQQPPAIKVRMLENPAVLPGLEGTQRSELLKLYKYEAKKVEIQATVSKVVNTARDVNTILSNLGDQDPRINQVVQYASVAQTALNFAFSTPPNPIGAIAVVSGLFGNQREDPTQAGLQQISQQLSGLKKQIDEVMKLQVETLSAIEDLAKQLEGVERRLTERLVGIERRLQRIEQITTASLWEQYGVGVCTTAWNERNAFVANTDDATAFDDKLLRFTSGRAIERFVSGTANYSKVFSCAGKLSDLYNHLKEDTFQLNPLHLDIAITNVEDKAEHGTQLTEAQKQELKLNVKGLNSYKSALYDPTWKYLQSVWPSDKLGGKANLLGIFANPSQTLADLDDKWLRLKDAKPDKWHRRACAGDSILPVHARVFLCTDEVTYDEARHGHNEINAELRASRLMEQPILREQIGSLVKWTALVARPYDFAKGGGSSEAMTMRELVQLAHNTPVRRGKDLLRGALFVLDVAIAQQAMLYGDMTAKFIVESLWDGNLRRFKTEDEVRKQTQDNIDAGLGARRLLQHPDNPWLREAVAMVVLNAQFKRCKVDDPQNSMNKPAACKPRGGRQTLYSVPMNLFLPVRNAGDGKSWEEVQADPQQVQAGTEWMRNIFDLSDDVKFSVVGGPKDKRTVIMKMAGLELPLPDVATWTKGALRYPRGLQERVRERELITDNLLDYTILNDVPDAGERMARILAIADQK